MEEKERFELFGEHCIKDNNPDARPQLLDAYVACVILNEQYKHIKDLEAKLEEKEKYTYTGKEVGEIERKYDEKIDTLEQKLKSQQIEIVEKIKEQIFNHFNVKNIEEYERLSLLNALFTADAVAEILDTILKEYQK